MRANTPLLLLNCLVAYAEITAAFHASLHLNTAPRSISQHLPIHSVVAAVTSTETQESIPAVRPSYYRTPYVYSKGGIVWAERKRLEDVKVGDRLEGWIVQEYLSGDTGPKVFLEVGVGRYNPKTRKWKLANAMLRLDKTKLSATQKKVARLKKKTIIECWVSRVRPGNGQLEVVLKEEQVPLDVAPKISTASLTKGHELVGTVARLENYGVFVDIGANRLGLLHIQKVADFFGSFIDQKKGLAEAGLEQGAKIKVQVESTERKRIALDFTDQSKQEAEHERLERQRKKEEKKLAAERSKMPVAAVEGAATCDNIDVDDNDPYAEYAVEFTSSDSDEEAGYDDYDEERDIEDALGLGIY